MIRRFRSLAKTLHRQHMRRHRRVWRDGGKARLKLHAAKVMRRFEMTKRHRPTGFWGNRRKLHANKMLAKIWGPL